MFKTFIEFSTDSSWQCTYIPVAYVDFLLNGRRGQGCESALDVIGTGTATVTIDGCLM